MKPIIAYTTSSPDDIDAMHRYLMQRHPNMTRDNARDVIIGLHENVEWIVAQIIALENIPNACPPRRARYVARVTPENISPDIRISY